MFDPGSFRDPSGRIARRDGRILRAVFAEGAAGFEVANVKGVYAKAIAAGRLLDMQTVDADDFPGFQPAPVHLVEHPCLDFISYPYEWTFSALKAAALLHLDFHLELLEDDFTLSDATAYNVQFEGARPVFIDHLSIVPYEEGSLWAGQRQFSMQFLNPLLLWSKRGIAPNAWYRGNIEGIAPEDLSRLLSARNKMSFNVLAHVVAQAHVSRRAISMKTANSQRQRHLSKRSLTSILRSLHAYIAGLRYPAEATIWSDYAGRNSYDDEKRSEKHEFVRKMTTDVAPRLLFDVGCNSGDFTQTAMDHGAGSAVGFDFDFGALEQAFARFSRSGAQVLPLWLDATNPSPAQGWAGAERKSLADRGGADALLALAVIHHLAIARNIPLEMAVDWLMSLAPTGVMEFPSKSDPMVQELLASRRDIFPEYTEEAFLAHVARRGAITEQTRLGGDGRLMVRYDRRS